MQQVIRNTIMGEISMEQQIRFCTTTEGIRLAYSTVGKGPALVCAPPMISHLEFEWKMPLVRPFFEKLAIHNMVVRYDKHGIGLSDRDRTDFTLEKDVNVIRHKITKC